jgi:hypothetical protein
MPGSQNPAQRAARFQLDASDRWAKHATLTDTESEFIAYVDTDDVPRADVIATAEDIVRILNEHAEEIRTEDLPG